MNNKELSKKFDKIDELDNSLDIIAALTKLKKEYKSSDFYKTTRFSVYKAYELYHKNDLISVVGKLKTLSNAEKLSQFIQKVVDGLAPDTFQNLVDKISDMFNPGDLQPQQENLQELINELKILK